MRGDVGDVHPDADRARRALGARAEIASSKSRALAGSIVNVASSRRSRLRRARAPARARRPPGPRCSTAAAKPRLRPRSSISASITSRATSGRPSTRTTRAPVEPRAGCAAAPDRPRRARPRAPARSAGEPQRDARGGRAARAAPAGCSRGGNSGSAVRKRPRRSSTATIAPSARTRGPRRRLAARLRAAHLTLAASVLSATARPWGVSTPWATSTSGVMPAPCLTPPPPRLRPLGVKYSPTVMSSAPPLDERLLLLEDALAERVGADDGGAAVILQRGCDDLGGGGGVGVHEHDHRDLGGDRIAGGGEHLRRLRAPARGHDRALGDEDAGDQLRLLDEAAAVVAQVEDDPASALVQLVFDRFAHFGVRAGAEAWRARPRRA